MIQRRFFSSCRDELPQLIRKRVQKLEEREEAFNKRMKKKQLLTWTLLEMQVISVLRFNVGRRAPASAHVEGRKGP